MDPRYPIREAELVRLNVPGQQGGLVFTFTKDVQVFDAVALYSLTTRLVTDGTVANRRVQAVVVDSDGRQYFSLITSAIVANISAFVCLYPKMEAEVSYTDSGSFYCIAPMPVMPVENPSNVRLEFLNAVPLDTLSNTVFMVLGWRRKRALVQGMSNALTQLE